MSLEILDPETLLSGPPANPLSPIQLNEIAVMEQSTTEVRRLADLVKSFSRAGTAAKALAGIHLRHLRQFHVGDFQAQGGRPKKTPNVLGFSKSLKKPPHAAAVSGDQKLNPRDEDLKNPHDGEFSGWGSFLEDRIGITTQTASNWIKIGVVVEEMAITHNLELKTICEKLPWDWTEQESAALDATVQHLTADKTQRDLLKADFLTTLGWQPNPTGNNPDGKNGSGKPQKTLTPSELLAARQDAARLALYNTTDHNRAARGSIVERIVHHCDNGGKELESLPQSELRYLYEFQIKPFADLIRKLANL
jgi:hypothetical protein